MNLKAVQEVQASIAHYKAHEGWVVTNSNFTESAINLGKSNGVRLIGRNELVEMMLQTKQGTSGSVKKPISQAAQQSSPSSQTQAKVRTCEQCGKEMILKRNSMGTAYICKGYPQCKNVKHIS